MSNDDLFEDNEVILDDTHSITDELKEDKEAGFSVDSKLKAIARDLAEKLSNVENFSFSLYSTTYFSFVNVPKLLFPRLYENSSPMVIAGYKASLGEHDIYTLHYLFDLQRKIIIIGHANEFNQLLLNLLQENSDGEPEDSFLTYCRLNLQKEIINNTFYLNELLNCYSAYCSSNQITIDNCLVEHQMKSYVDIIERSLYGDMFIGNNIAGVGEVGDFLERREKFMQMIADSGFKFINQVQSAIDTVKSEQERL